MFHFNAFQTSFHWKMFKQKLIPLVSAVSVGIGAYLGAKYEQHCRQDNSIWSFFPLTIQTAFAASKPLDSPVLSGSGIVPMNSSADKIMKFGFPSLENLRVYDDFVLSYDRRNRNAHWVFENLTPDKLNMKNVDRSKSQFFEDQVMHEKFRGLLSDYKLSGFDRGHLAAAGNHRHSQKSMDQTFTLSNISPQVGEGFNRGIWNNLEKYVRSIARKNRNTYVCTGPLYLPRKDADGKLYVKYQVIGRNHIAVPTHFFKVLAIETPSGEYELLSFILPNEVMSEKVPLKNFLVPVDSIERAAGFLLFDKLSRNLIKSVNGQKPR